MTKSLLIVDDEANMRHMLKSLLTNYRYSIAEAENGQIAISLLEQSHFDYILCDIKMPVLDGIGFLKQANSLCKNSTIIMMSAYGNVDQAIEAMKLGAYDYISKPFKTDEVVLTLKKAEERTSNANEPYKAKNQSTKRHCNWEFHNIVGNSSIMVELFRSAKRVAQYDASVLITGQSGTGKELISKAIHNYGTRSNNDFVAVNCGSIPKDLMESVFFGYVKGAFTGADKETTGLFQQADNGSIFLDEIGELPLDLQVRLLRVLQEKEYRPVGSNIVKQINVRVIAATAKDLHNEVTAGNFRQDLLYRLNVVELKVPPLCDRVDDIPLLVNHFIEKFTLNYNSNVAGISPQVLAFFLNYSWPGNVRELENTIEHAMIYTDSKTIEFESLPERLQTVCNPKKNNDLNDIWSIKKGKTEVERLLIEKALSNTKGNKSKAATLLEISYPSLLNKIKEYDIK